MEIANSLIVESGYRVAQVARNLWAKPQSPLLGRESIRDGATLSGLPQPPVPAALRLRATGATPLDTDRAREWMDISNVEIAASLIVESGYRVAQVARNLWAKPRSPVFSRESIREGATLSGLPQPPVTAALRLRATGATRSIR